MGIAERLASYLAEVNKRPHEWGVFDCALFCAEWVRRVRGTDPAEGLRGSYADEAGAQEILARFGGMAGLATHFLGEPCPLLHARQGDVVLFQGEYGPALGICDGPLCAFVADSGLSFRQLAKCEAVWHV